MGETGKDWAGPDQVPSAVTELHHEVELGVVIHQRAEAVSEAAAMAHVGGYVLALDMTARNLQSLAKKAGNPWSVAKVVRHRRRSLSHPSLLNPLASTLSPQHSRLNPLSTPLDRATMAFARWGTLSRQRP